MLGLLALGGTARADSVLLHDGRELEGTVVDQTEKTVKLRVTRATGTAVLEIPREQVERITIFKASETEPARLSKDAEQALALGHRDDAIRILHALVDARPGDARARRDLAFAELLNEQLDRAKDDYARAFMLDETDVESLIGLGYTSQRLGERDAAITAYRKATGVAPRHVKPWLALAELLLARNAKGDREDAVTAAKRALEAEPRSVDAALLEAEGLARSQGLGSGDDHKAALELLEKFIAAGADMPGITRIARRAADLAFGAGDAARAREVLSGVIARAPRVSEDERARLLALEALYGWFAAGREGPVLGLDPASDQLDVAAALRRLDLALEAVPAEGDLLLARTRLLVRSGRRPEAAEAAASAEAALSAGPHKDDARVLKTFLEVRKTDAPLDEKSARRLAELLPFAFDVHEALGRSLEASDLAGARDAMKRAAELAPDEEKKRLAAEAERLEALRVKREKVKDL